MKTKKVVTIGGAMRDIFIEHEGSTHVLMYGRPYILLEEGKKCEVQKLEYFVGGGATNTATSFKRLGFEAEAFFKIGADQEGDFILTAMAEQNVSTQHCVRTDQAQTGTSFIIPSPSGNRAVLVYRGANTTLTRKEIPDAVIAACDLLYVTSLSDNASSLIEPITACAKKYNKPVAINPGGSQIRTSLEYLCDALPNVDTFIVNSNEAAQLMECMIQKNPSLGYFRASEPDITAPELLQKPIEYKQISFRLQDYFKYILNTGPSIAVVTNGAEGVYVGTKNCIYFYPSLPITATSTLGAGDAFGSTFVANMLRDKSIEEALIAGIINSCSVICHVGTQTGLLTSEELDEQLKHADRTLLRKFSL